jgi:glycerophosphoryl diester phosphodiesterase
MTSAPRSIDVFGHAGAAGFFPHNSAESLQKAIELGVDRIEVDVLATSEHALVLLHDSDLDVDGIRTRIDQLSLLALRDAAGDILTYGEAQELVGDTIPIMLDIKGRGYVRSLRDAFRQSSPERLTACSTHARVLRQIHLDFPDFTLGLSRGHSLTKVRSRTIRLALGWFLSIGQIPLVVAQARWCRASEFMINHQMCSRVFVRAAHRLGYRVNVWTVDDPEDIERAIDLGVDSITSNRPDRVTAALDRRGIPRNRDGLR